MARAALQIGVRELAEMADVATATIVRFEKERGGLNTITVNKLKAALDAAGLILIEQNGGGPGVRLREKQC
jgi:DNA-binding XRE family transcriptional regulator